MQQLAQTDFISGTNVMNSYSQENTEGRFETLKYHQYLSGAVLFP